MFHITVVDLDNNTTELDVDVISVIGGYVAMVSPEESKKPLSERTFDCCNFNYLSECDMINVATIRMTQTAEKNAIDYVKRGIHE